VSISEAYRSKSHIGHNAVTVPREVRRYDRGWVVG
jgi:hypothetical protein